MSVYLDYKHVSGSQESKPNEVDTTSSSTKVYLRKNITSVNNVDMDGNKLDTTHYEYDEAQLTPEEYKQYLADSQSTSTQTIMQTLTYIMSQLDSQ